MTLTKMEQATLSFYDKHAEEWRAARCVGNSSFWQEDIDNLRELVPHGKILEIGSGSGREAGKLIQAGFDYTGIDASAGLLEVAKRDNPGAVFIHEDVYDLTFPNGQFDGFWSAATLLHLPKKRVVEALKSIKRVVKKDGVGFISLKEGEGEKTEENTGRFFSYYQAMEFVEKLQEAGFELIKSDRRFHKRSNTTWLTFFVKNP